MKYKFIFGGRHTQNILGREKGVMGCGVSLLFHTEEKTIKTVFHMITVKFIKVYCLFINKFYNKCNFEEKKIDQAVSKVQCLEFLFSPFSFLKYSQCALHLQGCKAAFTSLICPHHRSGIPVYLQHWSMTGRSSHA